MAGLDRSMGGEAAVRDAGREAIGDEDGDARDEPIDDDRDAAGDAGEHDADQGRDLQPADGGEYRQRIGQLRRYADPQARRAR